MKRFFDDLYEIITDIIKFLVWGIISVIGIISIPVAFLLLVMIYGAMIVLVIPIYVCIYLWDGGKGILCFLVGHRYDSSKMYNCMQDGNWILRSKCKRCKKEIYYDKNSGEWKEYINPNEYSIM